MTRENTTDDPKAPQRGVDLTIDIDATLDEVWQALTTAEGIARWFAPYAAVTPGEGGSVSVGWDPKEMWEQPITVWEPHRRMQTASEMPSKDTRPLFDEAKKLGIGFYIGYAELTPEGRRFNSAILVGPDGSIGRLPCRTSPRPCGTARRCRSPCPSA